MRKIVLLLLAVSSWLLAGAQTPFDEANKAYAEGRFAQAAAAYEELLQDQQNATLYYNAGNAYYKNGELGKAILNYERALLLDPNHADAKYNLEVANSKLPVKIDESDFFLSIWFKSIRNLFQEHTWIILSIVLFILCLAGILTFLLAHEPWLRKTAFHSAWVALLFCIITGINANSLHKRNTLRNEAIITQGIVTIMSSPDASGIELFRLYEGHKVTIRETVGEWTNVKAGKHEGWILSKNLTKI